MPTTILEPFVTEIKSEVPPEDYKPVIEYFSPRHALIIRANVLGHCLVNFEVYLIVQPIGYHACGQWVAVEPDDTAFKVCTTKLVISQAVQA
jgi:hypothetical protein